VYVCVIDDRGFIDDGRVIGGSVVVIVKVRTEEMAMRHKNPPVGRTRICSNCNIDADTWTKWRPTIISSTMPPAHPGRSPNISGNPNPTIIWIEGPATIVERSPTPGIIGNPHRTVGRINPVPRSVVRTERRTSIGNPDVAVLRIYNPLAV